MKRFFQCMLLLLCAHFSNGQRGIVTTIGGNGTGLYTGDGGPATAAGIGNSALGCGLNYNGDFFFTSRFDHVVRKISRIGIITTVAGTGTRGYSGDGGPATAARLNNPFFFWLLTLVIISILPSRKVPE